MYSRPLCHSGLFFCISDTYSHATALVRGCFLGVSFLAQNAGKGPVILDLKQPEDREKFISLVNDADVLVENFRPGVMARLGLEFDKLKEVNPRLVHCAISGFGQDGPLSTFPAYDKIIQGMSGVMSVTGDAEHSPYRVGYPLAAQHHDTRETGIVDAAETFFLESLKGQRHLSRPPRQRGGVAATAGASEGPCQVPCQPGGPGSAPARHVLSARDAIPFNRVGSVGSIGWPPRLRPSWQ